MSQAPQRRCDCESGEAILLFAARDYISGDRFEIVQCSKCELAFTHPVPEDFEWPRYYPETYYGDPQASRFPSIVEKVQNLLYASRARRVERRVGGKPGRVLDVGCGRGFLLRAFQRRGWDVTGTEITESAAAFARQKLHLPVHIGKFQELNLPENSFDAVIMWHVLEHFERINDALREVSRVLRSGGIFLVAVPNLWSFEARLTCDKWFHLDVPRHLTHFSRTSLRRYLEQTGFRIKKMSNRSLEYDFFSSMQSVLNHLGLRHNWLYNYLRQPVSNKNFGQVALHTLCLPLGEFAGCIALVAGGSTLIVYAHKV